MSFRRSKERVLQSRRWKQFVEQNAVPLASSGLLFQIYQSQEMFDHFLMHGYIDYHDPPIRFSVEQLSDCQLDALADLIINYLNFGFGNPGLDLGPELQSRLSESEIGPYGIQ